MDGTKRSSWEEWGQVDPLWAIVTEHGKEHGQWDPDEFFASGQATIDSLWGTADAAGAPKGHHRGLDFGCGIGRLTRPLGAHLDQVIGLDISPSMIDLARRYNRDHGHLSFQVHEGDDLRSFADGSFDVVCSLLVLQHLPSHEAIATYIGEFIRVLAPGGLLIMQLPDHVPGVAPTSWRTRLRPRTRLAEALHASGVSPKMLYNHLGWKPEMTMRAFARDGVVDLIGGLQARSLWSSEPAVDDSGVSNVFYLITKD